MTGTGTALSGAQRAHRNQHPHAEARLAMAMWGYEYAFEQRGGSMDFWDSLSESRKRLCIEVVSAVFEAAEKNGRAVISNGGPNAD